MKNRFRAIFQVPATSDPDDTRRRRILNILLVSTSLLTVLGLVVAIIIYKINKSAFTESDMQTIYVSGPVLLIITIIIFVVNRVVSGRLAGTMFLLMLMVLFVFTDTTKEVSNGRTLFVFAIPVLISSLLLYPGASFIFAGLSALEITLLSYSISQSPNTPAIIGFFLLAVVSWLSAGSLEQALRDLREINANLDKIVNERTHDLAESLARERIEAGRNQAILSSIADGVVVFNASNMVMLANPTLSQLTAIPLETLEGMKLNEFIQAGELTPANRGLIKELIENPDKMESTTRVEWGTKTLSVSIARVQDALTNQNIGAVAVFRDITREAELEKMKETFVAVVSHELRTPLNAVFGYAEMLKEAIYGSLNDKQSSVVERIMVNTQRLLAMVGDLLDEAQMRAGKLFIKKQAFRTASLLENMHITMDKIATDKGLYLTDELDAHMPETIIGDSQRLQQIIINLVNNSAKFTASGGIHVRILLSNSEPNHWVLEVADTGSGISQKETPYIFEIFRQTENITTRQHGGFGLGLSIVKQLVELMNGHITVKSELTKGSLFTITLPFIVKKDI